MTTSMLVIDDNFCRALTATAVDWDTCFGAWARAKTRTQYEAAQVAIRCKLKEAQQLFDAEMAQAYAVWGRNVLHMLDDMPVEDWPAYAHQFDAALATAQVQADMKYRLADAMTSFKAFDGFRLL